jgi:hypothetical protein
MKGKFPALGVKRDLVNSGEKTQSGLKAKQMYISSSFIEELVVITRPPFYAKSGWGQSGESLIFPPHSQNRAFKGLDC